MYDTFYSIELFVYMSHLQCYNESAKKVLKKSALTFLKDTGMIKKQMSE